MQAKRTKIIDRLYTFHGQKITQGKLVVINGKKSLASFKGETITGYSTLEEIQEEIYTRELPQYTLNF